MRAFAPHDSLEPVAEPPNANVKGLGLAIFYLLFGLVWVGIGIYGLSADGISLAGLFPLGCGVICVLAGVWVLRRASWLQTLMTITVSWTFAAGFWMESPYLGAPVAAMALFGFWYFLRSRKRTRRIAREMHERSQAAHAGCPDCRDQPDPGLPRRADPLSVEVYDVRELPPLTYQPRVAADSNLAGQPPRPILILYNFISGTALNQECTWRRFGPVHLLASPQLLFQQSFWSSSYMRQVEQGLLPDCASIDRRLSAAAEAPLPPGSRGLQDYALLSGGYPQHLFLCSDNSWQHAVVRLFERAELILIDAAGYSPARAGLNWQIACAVDHAPTENMVVLIDAAADFVALAGRFRDAWANMRTDSPNNRSGAAPLRFVLVYSDPQFHSNRDPDSPDQPDSANLVPGLNFARRGALRRTQRKMPYDDRIYGLLRPAARRAAV